MSMTKEQQAEARRKLGQTDAVLGLDLVGQALKGSLDYFGVPQEHKLVTDASPAEVLAPGFLDPAVEANKSYLGALVRVIAKSGSADPRNWSVGMMMVVAVKGMRVTDEDGEEVRNDKGRMTFHETTKVGIIQHFKTPAVVDDRTHDAPTENKDKTRRRLQ